MAENDENTNTAGGPGQQPPATPVEKPVSAPPKPEPPARQAPPVNPAEDELRSNLAGKADVRYGLTCLEIHTSPDNLLETCGFLLRRCSTPFTFLRNVTAADYKDDGQIELVYHVCPFPDMTTVCIKVRVPRDTPSTHSVCALWPTANWQEREVLDLFGVEFKGHPDPERILLPPEWEGHPLRKDYVHKPPELPCIPHRFKQTN